jgi:hypothetical protein
VDAPAEQVSCAPPSGVTQRLLGVFTVPVEMSSLTSEACPPHYWCIETRAHDWDHWTCYRCGTQSERPRGRLRRLVEQAALQSPAHPEQTQALLLQAKQASHDPGQLALLDASLSQLLAIVEHTEQFPSRKPLDFA